VGNPLSEEAMLYESSIAAEAFPVWSQWEEKLRDEYAEAIHYAPGFAPPEAAPEPEEPEWFDVPVAELDELTGLYNRRSFHDALEHEAARAQRDDEPLALVLLDMKAFKSINDKLGRSEGNRVLREVAVRLRKVVGLSLKAYRINPDEFAIVFPGSKAEADELLGRLHAGVSRRKIGEAGRIHLSVGVSELRPDEDAGNLFARAGMRMRARHSPEELEEPLRETACLASFPVFALDLPAEDVCSCRPIYHPAETARAESISLSYELAFRFVGTPGSLSLFIHETAAEDDDEGEGEPFEADVGGRRITGKWGKLFDDSKVGPVKVCVWDDDKHGPTAMRFECEGTRITLLSPDVALGALLPLLTHSAFRRVGD
jgi:diguanylate cyclase (GGDEF)-like protein